MKESFTPFFVSRVTHPKSNEFSSYEQGVAILVVNKNGKILLGEEAHDDPTYGRKKGQLNIITETHEPGERIKATVIRALEEELGSTYSFFSAISGSYRETTYQYVQAMGYNYKYRCICLRYEGDPSVPAHELFRSKELEIICHRWIDPNKLDMYDIEEGARAVIDYYRESVL